MTTVDEKIPFYKDYSWWWFTQTRAALVFILSIVCAVFFLLGFSIIDAGSLSADEAYSVGSLAMIFLIVTLYLVLSYDGFWTYYTIAFLWGMFGAVRYPDIFDWTPEVLGFILSVWFILGLLCGIALIVRGLLTDKWRSNLW